MRRIALLSLMCVASPVAAQSVVNSDRVDAVSVTLYRDPDRREGAMNANWPTGYALITETRTITLPAGRNTIRFAGVAEGMMPETAIVTGLPKQVNEKNRDARLISPAALIDAYLKRRVTIRRTSRATGKTVEQEAVIQSGPSGGVVLTTSAGVEALGCSGLPEGLKYPGVPDDLAAKPTLSVQSDATGPATVTVQLSYLAQGFDWSANYVAQVADDGKTLDLFAWLTVANGGSQGFAQARMQTVAGAPNKEANVRLPRGPAPELHLQCWPMDITSAHPRWGGMVPPPPPPAPMPVAMEAMSDIVVTGMLRKNAVMAAPVAAMVATQEELGDLKLYRVPEPVTVAAQSTKQVAMIDQKKVKFDRIYRTDFDPTDYFDDDDDSDSYQTAIVLRTENTKANGLGLPLPSGRVAAFEPGGSMSLLVGEGALSDRAIGQEVEIAAGNSSDVRYQIRPGQRGKTRRNFTVRVTNARPVAVTFEMPIAYQLASANAKLVEHKSVKTWRVTVPANGNAKLDFAIKQQ